MEENKKCCENSESEKGKDCCGSHNCCSWAKCPMLKYLVWIAIIVIIFCLGAQYEKTKGSFEGPRCGGKMMNYGPEKYDSKLNQDGATATDSITVETQLPPKQ